ncbi:hypothetical protein FOCC_FOCC008651 [Frankliniella occidentalis]|uniref:Acireductone dioxygenase n=1 Tax=Frankliniella occidentalis TaxID=133901 RepID=A0A6J1S0H4_FRAOC|nr:acireductone dioxygenase [Frankliniella occidentalis]KAE8744743.1 hypothetical protein FOCC_FOCC008651 [Frankliniella occidentalis]
MVRAWYMDDSREDQRLEHHRNPPKFIEISDLCKATGVEHFKINHESFETDMVLQSLKNERGYTYEDEFQTEDSKPDYEAKLRTFFTEHIHTDEEIRLCLDGSGFFDVRDANDEWIRIEVTPGDLIIIPSGIYHRFTLDAKNFIRVKRYFVGEPVWTPYNRPADDMDVRQTYLKKLKAGF